MGVTHLINAFSALWNSTVLMHFPFFPFTNVNSYYKHFIVGKEKLSLWLQSEQDTLQKFIGSIAYLVYILMIY